METYTITTKDMDTTFFHFTKESNLKNITKNGLLPFIGKHSKYIEKSRKVFFLEGLDNLLILFDCWINVYYYMPKIPFIYTLGAYLLKKKWFPMFIADGYFGVLKKTKLHRKRAFKVFEKLLDHSILLQLNLEENRDFSFEDQDEIKYRGYKKRHLEIMGYSPMYSSLDSGNMDHWNMHTFSNHGVDSTKIKLCQLKNGSTKLTDIFKYCVLNTHLDLENKTPILYDYLQEQEWFNITK